MADKLMIFVTAGGAVELRLRFGELGLIENDDVERCAAIAITAQKAETHRCG
jgi:hypothetical protein